MAKKKKDVFDAASLNKEQYLKDNYIAKTEETNEDTKISANKKKQTAIASMLFVLLLLVVFVFAWSYFFTPQGNDENIAAASATAVVTPSPSPDSTIYPATPTPRAILTKYDEYFDVYPDIVGWISIDNIKVDYPVVQSPDPNDPHKYLLLGPNEVQRDSGSIYLDIRNSVDAKDRHTIIYGHNMKNGSMFGQLDKYLSRTFFYDHLIIRYDTLYQELEWEVFNVFETTTDFYYIQTYFKSDEDFVNLMMQCVYKSYYHDNTTVIGPEDRILTLSTCTNRYDNGRLVLQARLITPLEGEEDIPIEAQETDASNWGSNPHEDADSTNNP